MTSASISVARAAMPRSEPASFRERVIEPALSDAANGMFGVVSG